MATSPNQPSTAHKLKFIDLTKEIEDCSKDQTLSMYHYNTGSSTGVGPGNSNHSSGEIMNQNYHCGGSQRKKINKRFRNNPGFTSNFFFFPSSVAVNGNTSANMAINHKENSPPTPLSATSQTQSNVHTNQRKWNLTNTKKDQQSAGANPSDGKPFLISQQDDKGNAQLIENEETCHAFNEKVVKSPQSATPRSKRVSKSSRLQRRYSCSDYLPTSIPPTEQELAKIDRIYSPMSNYCFTPIPQGFYNFTFQSPNANASQQSPPTTHDSNSYHSTCYNTNDQSEERSAGEDTDDWTFLDPNLKKRRPSFDLNNDEMDKLFNAFSFEPIREESDQNQQVIVDENSHSMSNFANQFQQTAVLDEQPQFMFPQISQQDEGIGFMDLLQNNNNTQFNQVPFPTPSQVSNETELLFNSLPEELKKQLVSFLILHNNQKKEDDQLVPDESTPPTSSMKEEGERRSTSTQEIEPVIGEESAVDVDQEQPLFEPITEIGLSELKDFGLLEDLEDAAILNTTNESNDDFEQFLNNL